MSEQKLKFQVTEEVRGKLAESGIAHGENVHVLASAYDHFIARVRHDYDHLKEAEQHALALLCCLTHPNHVEKHEEMNHPMAAKRRRILEWLEREDVSIFGAWGFRILVLVLMLLIASHAHAQHGTSRIDTIQFQDNAGLPVGAVAAPFMIKAGSNCSLAKVNSVVTFNCTGGAAAAGGSNGQVQLNSAGALAGITTFTSDGTVNTAQAGVNWFFTDTADTSKKFRFDVSNLSTATTRIVNIPDANSTTAQAKASAAHKWLNAMSAQGVFTATQPSSTDLGDFSATPAASSGQIPIYDSTAPNAAGGTGAYVPGDPFVQGTQAAGSTSLPNPVSVGGSDYGGTPALRAIKVDASGNVSVTPTATPNPSNLDVAASTLAKETGGNLAAIKTDVDKIPAQGQALSAASMPVVLPATQITTLTPPAAITNFANETGGNLAASKTDLDTIAGAVSSAKVATKSADGDFVTIGAKADAKSAATDTTAITVMQVLKELSFLLQNSLPLPTGAAQDSSLTTLDTDVKSNVTLHAGANLIGKAGFDQTTLGATNGVTNYQLARSTGTLTSTTCPGTGCVSVSATGYGIATVTISGTYSLTALPEFSDDGGTTWYGTTCTQTDASTQVITFGALVSTSRAWDCSVYAASNFRVRASAFTSGTANIGITLSSAPIEAAPTVALASGSTVGLAAGSALIGEIVQVATATTTDSALENFLTSAATTNATGVKGSAGNLYGYECVNTTTTTYYLRLYNLASAPTCSSATGFIKTVPCGGAAAAGQTGGIVRDYNAPVGYSTGIGYCLTGGGGSTDNTAAATGVYVTIKYK